MNIGQELIEINLKVYKSSFTILYDKLHSLDSFFFFFTL